MLLAGYLREKFIVKYIRVFSLVFLSVLMAPLSLQAADETDEPNVETTEEDPNKGIVSQSSPIIGYQPLTVAGQLIEATYLEESLGERHGVIILLHDRSDHLEDQGVVTPLRHQMPKLGWSTLTIALEYPFEPAILLSPTLENTSEAGAPGEITTPEERVTKDEESTEEETLAGAGDKKKAPVALPPISNQQRLEAAIAFLQEKQIERFIFIGHGAGGNLAVEILDKETTPIQALVLIDTPALTTNEVFKTMRHPILEIYGSNGVEGVDDAVQHRRVLMKREGSRHYATREIVGADHFFTGLQAELISTLRGWLRSTFLEEKD